MREVRCDGPPLERVGRHNNWHTESSDWHWQRREETTRANNYEKFKENQTRAIEYRLRSRDERIYPF